MPPQWAVTQTADVPFHFRVTIWVAQCSSPTSIQWWRRRKKGVASTRSRDNNISIPTKIMTGE